MIDREHRLSIEAIMKRIISEEQSLVFDNQHQHEEYCDEMYRVLKHTLKDLKKEYASYEVD